MAKDQEDAVKHGLSWTIIGAAAALAACAQDTMAPDATAQLDQDIAVVATDATAQDVELMRGPGGRFGLGLPADPARFECGTFSRGGVTITRTCTFLDDQGDPQDAYDPETTASVTVHAEVTGAIERGDWSATSFSRVRDLTETGLLGDETSITWNGTGSGSMNKVRQTRAGDSVEFDMTSNATVTDVVIPVPRTSTSWPLSGTVSRTVTVSSTGGPHDGATRTRDVTITFDGTQYATVTVNGETFTVDLARRQCVGRGPHRPGRPGQHP
jgi:hypothetical protein